MSYRNHFAAPARFASRLAALALSLAFPLLAGGTVFAAGKPEFQGKFFRGSGDLEYLRLLDQARRMFAPDPEFENLSMLYMPSWNGLVEGPTWDAWWIQNSYGTTYSALPFLQEPFLTFLQNSQDLWFDQMGDGKRVGAAPPFNWVAPDGCLCDAARPGWIVYRQGDGRTHIHDWGMEFTAAGLMLQSELLLISRDNQAIGRYLPKLERCANFIETRRDPTNNLFLAGPAGNLLAPSFAGWKKPDGTYGKAYLAGLSVTYIAALERLAELEKLAGRAEQSKLQSDRRDSAKRGLALLTTDEGYLINSLDPDGTRHGVYGAAQHGYFESSPNHDAIAFRVVDQTQAERIFDKIQSIPGVRPHHFILPNYPSYDDMYEKPEGLWAFGTWVNGGHWSTCEARMMLAYYRLGKYEDARASMKQLLGFAERFRMDNPLVKFGSDVYQPNQPVNLTYDAFGPAAAFIRGLFEYRYDAQNLTLALHIPPGLSRVEQRFPIRFGAKRLYLATTGTGPVTAVRVNGKRWKAFDAQSVQLAYDGLPDIAAVEISLGESSASGFRASPAKTSTPAPPALDSVWDALASQEGSSPTKGVARPELKALFAKLERLRAFSERLDAAGLSATYEAAHARLALDCANQMHDRLQLLASGNLRPLTNAASQAAANQLYFDTTRKLTEGLYRVLEDFRNSPDQRKQPLWEIWEEASGAKTKAQRTASALYPGKEPGPMSTVCRGDTITITNQAICVTWQTGQPGFRLKVVKDVQTGRAMTFKGELFEVVLSNGRSFPASSFVPSSKPRVRKISAVPLAPRLAARENSSVVELGLRSMDRALQLTWRATACDNANYVRQELEISSTETNCSIKELKWLDEPISESESAGLVDGSPVVAGAFFLGCEDPHAVNTAGSDSRVSCTTLRNVSLGRHERLTCSFVLGVAPEAQMRRGFLYYLERERAHPYRPFLHYNSWYDIAWEPFALNETNCLEAIDLFGERFIQPFRVTMDALVFDDGWDNPRSLWSFHSGFPNGFKPLAELCKEYGTHLGVWLSPFGGYGESRKQRLTFGSAQGYETHATGFSLAGPKYYAAFKGACVQMIRKYGVNHFKFDGIATGMYASGGADYYRDTEAMRRLMLELRQEEPSLYINLTTGSWPSPFWLRYADSVWRQGGDMGLAGKGTRQQQWLTYRDQEVYRNIVRKGPLFPLNSLMTQGVAYSRKGSAGDPGFNSEGFRDDVRAFFGSGTGLQELYIEPDKLTPGDWTVLAETAKWSRRNSDVLVDTHWIGGDPSRGEVYGCASWNPRRGIIMLRNPDDQPHTFSLNLAEAFELGNGAAQNYVLKSPWAGDAAQPGLTAQSQSILPITLPPFGVLVYESTPEDDRQGLN